LYCCWRLKCCWPSLFRFKPDSYEYWRFMELILISFDDDDDDFNVKSNGSFL
jgi:hypothetical protein